MSKTRHLIPILLLFLVTSNRICQPTNAQRYITGFLRGIVTAVLWPKPICIVLNVEVTR